MPTFKQLMAAWAKSLADWITEHPERDWLKELYNLQSGVTTEESTGGDHPPPPPPNP